MFDAITYALSKAFTKKAIAEADAKNMKVKDYDSVGNGVVNDSRKLGGNLPSYYASMASIVGKMDKSIYDENDNGIVDNAEKVNNHTVASDVPANAQFTDTKGSYITLTTESEQGENVTLSIGGATYTGAFSAQGVCTFEGVTETGTATISTQNITKTENIPYFGVYAIDITKPFIFGVEWDGTASTVLTRTDGAADFVDPVPYYLNMTETPSSPFDDIMPWSGMTTEERTGGTMVKIPKFWYKLEQTGNNGLKLQIANKQVAGFSVSPAHMNRGDGKGERDVVYVGKYHSNNKNYKSDITTYPSAWYMEDTSPVTARSRIHSLNSKLWLMDYATLFTIQMLYLVEYADWNSQKKIGMGGRESRLISRTVDTPIPYHTGTSAEARYGASGYGFVQYRNIRDLWSGYRGFVDGCYYISSGLKVILNPSSFSSYTAGTLVGKPHSGYPLWQKVVDSPFKMFIPQADNGNGSADTYAGCDEGFYYTNGSNNYNFKTAGAASSSGEYYQFGIFALRDDTFDKSSSGWSGYRILELS